MQIAANVALNLNQRWGAGSRGLVNEVIPLNHKHFTSKLQTTVLEIWILQPSFLKHNSML